MFKQKKKSDINDDDTDINDPLGFDSPGDDDDLDAGFNTPPIDDDDDDEVEKDYKKLYTNQVKSYKNLQRYLSQNQKTVSDLTKTVEELKEQGKTRSSKLLEAFGIGTPDDEEAKKLIEEFKEDEIGTINKIINSKLEKELPEMKKQIQQTGLSSDIKTRMDDIEEEYDINFTPELARKVSIILKTRINNEFKKKDRKGALLTATQMAIGKPLEKRTPGAFFSERGSGLELKKAIKSTAERIREGIIKAGKPKNDAMSMRK